MLKKFFLLLLTAACAASIIFLCQKLSHSEPASDELILTESQLEPYLNIRGWDTEFLSDETVRIPESFDGVYESFAEIQKKSGFDLESRKGKEVRRVMFKVKNYGGDSEVAAELLLDGDVLIGSALIENKPDGFIKPVD